MSSANVIVLAPNGRRQTVKCTPNTTILQVIEEVCKKQGYNPIEYDIKHHNKVLDTTVTLRFSGLPNNAQLELTPATKSREESDIILAINFEDGSRKTGTFKPNDTLLNVLTKVCPEKANLNNNPVVIYTRREIYGRELENCTLRSLGLMGGRAMIRVLNRNPESLRQQANVSAPLPSKPVEEKPYVRKFQPLEKEEKVQLESSHAQDVGNVQESKINKDDEGHRLGSTKDENGVEHDIKPQKNVKNPTVDLLKLAKEKRKSLDGSGSTNVQQVKRQLLSKDQKIDTMDVDESGPSEHVAESKNIDEEFIFCGDRNGMLFSLESAQSVPTEDLPDDFFELTIDDAKKILRDVKRMRNELENQHLRTSQLRSLDETKKQLNQLNRYKRAIIRVQFPDRTVVQGTFKPTETVQDVLDFVKNYLDDPNCDFYIYATPPKSILSKEQRLIEVGCVPGALLHFGTHQDRKDGFIKKEFQNLFTTNSVASLAAAKIRHANTRKLEAAQDADDDIMDVAESTVPNNSFPVNYGAGTSQDTSTSERRLVSNKADFPKWFKPV